MLRPALAALNFRALRIQLADAARPGGGAALETSTATERTTTPPPRNSKRGLPTQKGPGRTARY
eukprot:702007-Lingulodinium_polyedra.AAC.1